MYKCEIVVDSIYASNRLTTFLVTYPRIIHAEMLRHRAFSRNTSSSRAIPIDKMIADVVENPFIPIAWQKSHHGMQGFEYHTDENFILNERAEWLLERERVVESVKARRDKGVTKQICNRQLELYQYVTELITSTQDGLENFFKLRLPMYQLSIGSFRSKREAKLAAIQLNKTGMFDGFTELDWIISSTSQAEVHIQKIAEMMYDAYSLSSPKPLTPGEYHLPFDDTSNSLSMDDRIKVSVARCARLSYKTLGESPKLDYDADIKLYDRLLSNGHLSPFEHIATPSKTVWRFSNFIGWKSHRNLMENLTHDSIDESFPELVRKIILDKLGVDVATITRKREFVDARLIFYSAVRERGYSLHKIGQFVNKDHASVLHGLNKVKELSHDKSFRNKFVLCMSEINSVVAPSSSSVKDALSNEIVMLNRQIKELTLYRDKYFELKEKDDVSHH